MIFMRYFQLLNNRGVTLYTCAAGTARCAGKSLHILLFRPRRLYPPTCTPRITGNLKPSPREPNKSARGDFYRALTMVLDWYPTAFILLRDSALKSSVACSRRPGFLRNVLVVSCMRAVCDDHALKSITEYRIRQVPVQVTRYLGHVTASRRYVCYIERIISVPSLILPLPRAGLSRSTV
jgi:hypothetical protein